MAMMQPFIISLCHSQPGASHMITQSAAAPLLTWSLVNQFVQVLNAVFKHIFNNEKLSVLKERSYVFEFTFFSFQSFQVLCHLICTSCGSLWEVFVSVGTKARTALHVKFNYGHGNFLSIPLKYCCFKVDRVKVLQIERENHEGR